NFKFKTLTANLADSLYPPTYWQSLSRQDLLEFNLIMSSADISNLSAAAQESVTLGYSSKQAVKSQPISLIYETLEYPVKISFHGGGANDFVYNKIDYDIKISGSKTINNYDSFTLFNPSIHGWIKPLLANQIAASLNLFYNEQFPVAVKINHKTSGIYLFEEKINAEFLKKRQLNQAQIIKLRDETRLPHRINTVALNAHHLSGFDFAIANIDPLDNQSEKTLFQLDQFFKAVKSQDLEQIVQYIDLDYWARYDAYRELLAIDHDTAGDNLAMFFQPLDNKFYPVVRNEGDLNQLSIIGGTTLKSFNQYDPHLADQYDYPRLFLLLNRQPEFRILKYKYLYQLVTQQNQLQENFSKIYSQFANIFIYDTSDEASVWQKKRLFNNYLKIFDHNFSLIKQELEFAQVAINIINTSGQTRIEIVPDAVIPVKFDQFDLEFQDKTIKSIVKTINQRDIMADFSADFNLIPTTFTFIIPTKIPAVAVQVKAQNKITGTPLTGIYSAVASNNSPSD
ncbi:MAG: CotH kinase family protein, partial [Candidatus Beckwithbacteria bacterium]